MTKLLQLQLENEKAIYEKRKAENRNDPIALMLLKRIEIEINTLERLIDATQKTRQKITEHRYPGRLIRYVREALHRFRYYKDRRHHSLPTLPARTTLQTQAGSQ